MRHGILILAAVLALGYAVGHAQSPTSPAPAAEPQGTYVGVLVSPVPEVLYEHLPLLPRNRGIVITHILPSSPAAQAELKKHDILLAYNGTSIEDCGHFARLVRADKPNQKVQLHLLRGGKEASVELTLGVGPLLTVAQANRANEKGTAKPDGPGKVSVAVTPLQDNKMSVTIEYYEEGKLRTLTHAGTSQDIDREVRKLPPGVKDLARAALQRIRVLELEK